MNDEDNHTEAKLIGEIAWLMVHSRFHRRWNLGQVLAASTPAVRENCFRIYRNGDDQIVGFVTWARLTPEDQSAFLSRSKFPSMESWTAGKELTFIDFIAPFGHAYLIANDLKKIFPAQAARSLRVRSPDIVRGAIWHSRKKATRGILV